MKQASVRVIIIGAVGTLLCLFIFLLGVGFDQGMKRLLVQYEEDHIAQHVQSASLLLRSSLRPLADATRDWSRWDATYTFVTEKTPSFLTDELNDDLFKLYRLNFALILNKKHEVVFERFFDFTMEKDVEPSADVQVFINSFKELLVKKSGTGKDMDLKNSASPGVSGFVRHNDTWAYISAFPILVSTGKGEPNGVLIFGRLIDDRELQRMEKGMDTVAIHRLSHEQADTLLSQGVFSKAPCFIDYSKKGIIKAFHLIESVHGDDIVIFVEEPRDIYNQSIAMIRTLNFFVALSAAVTLILLFFLLEKLLLGPLKGLAKYVEHINDVKELPVPPRHWGYELSTFVGALRKMFSKVSEKQTIIEKQNADMRYTLTHDHLTGLSNAFQLECVFEEFRTDPQRDGKIVHFFYIWLVNLKLINSTLGFPAGDAILIRTAKRLKQACPDALSVASVDGHHFAVLYNDEVVGGDGIGTKCALLSSLLEEPIVLDECNIRPSVTIGVASYPKDSGDILELHKHAIIASNAVLQNTELNYMLYNASLLQSVTARVRMEEALLKAIENDEFVAFFQPKLDIMTRKIVGTEALVRWISAGKIIGPGSFISLADETGLIVQITWMMLEKACRGNQCFAAAGFDISVSVNVPVQVILHTDFVQKILAILKKTGMPSRNLEIEITEETVIADIEKTRNVIEELHRYDIKVSVDDFGTGYSSLQYLKKVPFDTIKIDKVFVDGIPGDKYDEAIVRACVDMAQALSLNVIVEGVETTTQWETVKTLGCHELQGYVVSKPVPSDEYIALLHQWNGTSQAVNIEI